MKIIAVYNKFRKLKHYAGSVAFFNGNSVLLDQE